MFSRIGNAFMRAIQSVTHRGNVLDTQNDVEMENRTPLRPDIFTAWKNADYNSVRVFLKNARDLAYLSQQNFDDDDKTILHYVCSLPKDKSFLANELISLLDNKIKSFKPTDRDLEEFLNIQCRESFHTALYYAIKNEHKDIFRNPIFKKAKYAQKDFFERCESKSWELAFREIDDFAKCFGDIVIPNLDTNGDSKTILHYLCDLPVEQSQTALRYVKKLFDIKRFAYTKYDMMSFLNAQTHSKNYTALHFAIENKNWKLVEYLLLKGADVNMRTIDTKMDALGLIYDRLYAVLLKLFDKGYQIIPDEYDPDNKYFQKMECNFTYIAGVADESKEEFVNAKYRETILLAEALRHPKTNRAPVLMHPLVQIFLYYKKQRMNCLFIISIIYHILWSVVISFYFVCNFDELEGTGSLNSTNEINGTAAEENGTTDPNSNSHCFIGPFIGYYAENGFYGYGYGLLLFLFWLTTAAKEFTEYRINPSFRFYIEQFENWGQILVLLFVPISTILTIIVQALEEEQTKIIWLRYALFVMNTFGVGIALLLIQAQSTKTNLLGVYNQLLRKVFVKFVKFFIAFLPKLIAFLVLFYRLIPVQFAYEKLLGLNKVLAMMTGELTYDDLFKDQDKLSAIYWILGNFTFLIFVVSVTIVLQNLLLALTIDDMEELGKSALAHHLAAQLEVMYLFEKVLTSDCLIRWFKKWGYTNFLNSLLLETALERSTDENKPKVLIVHMRKLPKKLQKSVADA